PRMLHDERMAAVVKLHRSAQPRGERQLWAGRCLQQGRLAALCCLREPFSQDAERGRSTGQNYGNF
ncbi:hypothetical protein WNY61_06125, partial [Sulfitobacter sp. AS92]|uniref:hypothetical protein n=1 Tax=Sulfitobacter sp. AS92 TaxID=3135783 RepID=UPI00317B6AD5